MLQAYKVLKATALPESVIRYVKEDDEYDENNSAAQRYSTIGSILSSTNFTWYANGPRLEVVSSKNGAKVAAWKFGSVLKDTTTKVVCVAEIPVFNIDLPLLVVGLECALTGGSICIFDIITSKVLRVIQLKDKVTSLCVINGGDGIFSTLGPLQAFDGIVAVGMAGGDVYLIDFCRQSIDDARYSSSTHEIKDELDACQITVLTSKDIENIELHKQQAAQIGNHLAIHLNALDKNNFPHFVLKGPSGEDRIHANKSEVTVSALHYSSQLGSVLVGYNFGAFQLWNIINMELVYTSPVYEGNIPISHFAVQEPTDDPRIFCYIWAIYSSTEPYQIGFPIAVLYALNFECKEWHDGYGYLYEHFKSCIVRFQNELSLPHHTTCNGKPKGGHCLRLHAFSKGNANRNSMLESHEDALTICWAIWNIWCRDRCEHTLLSIFDLNQWYKEHLPATPDASKYKNYMSYVSLSDLVFNATGDSSPIMDAHINEATINQFIGAQKHEEHYYPCTLAFECNACTENNLICISNQGQQRALLTFIETNGPESLLKPMELFEECMTLGLTPLFTELPQYISITFQREQILSIILEQQMVSCLCKCVSIWSNGSYMSAGCSLEFFLSWAWNRALVLKANAHKLCAPLFDYSTIKLDANSKRMLSNCFKQLSNLSIVYEFIYTRLSNFLPNAEIVQQQWNCLHLTSVYLEVLQWLLNVGLLPEYYVTTHEEIEHLDSLGAPYPVDSLLEYYNKRREDLRNLNKQKYSSDTSLLFIDNLVDLECGGDELHKYWKDDGGNGFYPPQSLQALLLTYLVDGTELMSKHCIIFYVFLDLAMALDQEKYKMVISHLIKFPAVFKLSPSIIRITQAFWQLDHGDFETAMELLLDAHIYPGDLKMWHHRIVMNALIVQDQQNFALLYLQVRRPPLTDVEDLYKAISLFVYNNMLDEAIYYQRRNSTKENELLLLRHIFEECDKNNQMKQLITYGLNQCEEEALMKYLEEVNHPNMEEFQVIYYLQRSRYMDIFEMQGDKPPRQLGIVGQSKMNFREGMVKTLSNFFPKISRNLINVCRQERQNLSIKCDRPKPMSVAIHDTKDSAKYKSTLIHGILRARETWTDTYLNVKLSNEEIPFLRTPVATPVRSTSKIPIISQKLINPDVSSNLDSSELFPSKKLKLSLRQSLGSTSASCSTNLIQLETPIFKRKLKKSADLKQKFNVCTPHSILKVKNLMSQSSHSGGDSPTFLQTKEISPEPVSPSKILRISPRKSLSRSTVRFEKLRNLTTSADTAKPSRNDRNELMSTLTISTSNENIKHRENDFQSNKSSLNLVSDDVNDVSISKSVETSEKSVAVILNEEVNSEDILAKSDETDQNSTVNLIDDVSVNLVDSTFLNDLQDTFESNLDTPKKKKFPPTPRSRRSYRDPSLSLLESIQTRSKTRHSTQKFLKDLPSVETPKKGTQSVKFPPSNSIVKGRKSLSRRVLENNAYATMLSTPNRTSLTTSHTVEKHHIQVEKDSPDLKKRIADFSKFISDLMVKSEDSDSEWTSLIHTEVQNSSNIQVLETNDDSLSSDISELDMSTHSLGLPSFVLNRSYSLPSNLDKDAEEKKLEDNVYLEEEKGDQNLNTTDNFDNKDNKISEIGTEQELDVRDDNYENTDEQIVNTETLNLNENPLENNVYVVCEQGDENLNVTVDEKVLTEANPSHEVEIVEIIEISDTSEESACSNNIHQSFESEASSNVHLYEDEELESDVESSVSADTQEEEAKEHVMEETYDEQAESTNKQLEELEKNIEHVEPSCPVTETTNINLENQNQAEAVSDSEKSEAHEFVESRNEISMVESDKHNVAKAEILELSVELHSAEISHADDSDASVSHKAEEIMPDLSPETKITSDTLLDESKILDASVPCSSLEMTSVDILDRTLKPPTDVMEGTQKYDTKPSLSEHDQNIADTGLDESKILDASVPCSSLEMTSVNILDRTLKPTTDDTEGTQKYDTKPSSSEHDQNIAAKSESVNTPLVTKLRRRVSSCDFESSPSIQVKDTKSRKRSASVDEPSRSADVKPGVSSKKEEDAAVLQLKRRLRSSSCSSDIKHPDGDDMKAKTSRNRRAASVSNYIGSSSDSPTKTTARRNQRASSVQGLPTVHEDDSIQKLKQNKHNLLTDSFEEYSTSRRLTRSQKSMLEKSKGAVEAKISSFKVSDKSILEAKVDIDDMEIENSSQSSITEESIGGKLRKRRQSQESNSSIVSTIASASDMGSPRRKGRLRRPSTDSAASSDRQLRSSSANKADQKKIQKLSTETDSESSDLRKSARRRLKSETTEKSSDSESVGSRKSARRQLISSETDLPQIPEENSSDTGKQAKDEHEERKRQKRKMSTKK